jgi:hypothetical protein
LFVDEEGGMTRMRSWFAAALSALLLVGGWGVAQSQSLKPARIAGVDWEPTLALARARAAREKKPIFLLHLFGRLDQEFC